MTNFIGYDHLYNSRAVLYTNELALSISSGTAIALYMMRRLMMQNKSKKILFIEDDANLSKVLTHIFSSDGYEVIPCLTGQTALEQIEDGFVADVVILDMELPDIAGLELLEKIKSQKAYAAIPIIINSGHSEFKSDFHSWLADAYIVKQPDPKSLKDVVYDILNKDAD
jgi:DNA-binding NtrC family response regulator